MSNELLAMIVVGLALLAWFVPASRWYVAAAAVGAFASRFLTPRKTTATVEQRKDELVEKLDASAAESQTEQRRIDDAASPAPDSAPVSDDVARLRAGLDEHRRAVADRDADDLGIPDRD